MNLTDQQKDLLRLLVSNHESTGGAEFIFVQGMNAAGLCYRGGESVNVACDDIDLRKLRQERLISLIPIAANQVRGKPTELGIAMVRRGFFITRVMKKYEARCPLLSWAEKERLNERCEHTEIELSRQIEFAAATIRECREQLKQMTDDLTKKIAEAALLDKTATFRREVIAVAETIATEGVREFAHSLLTSQRRLGVHADLLREYTARLAGRIRNWLNTSQVFQTEPLLPWQQDSITQRAIQTCEDVLAETKPIEGGGASDNEKIEGGLAGQNENEARTWPPIVQDWEALKSARGIITGEHERLPDADLRSILAGQYLIKPEDVNDGQIEYAALELCRHYGRVQIIPQAAPEPSSAVDEFQEPSPIPDAVFWKEREEAFHQHDTGANQVLGTTWFSEDGHWAFHTGSGPVSPDESILAFKPLAMEAARGIGSTRGAKSWVDWLDLLRCAKDEDTGKSLYAKNWSGSCVRSERELQRLTEAGEDIPAGGLIEFAETADGGVERRMYWDTNTAIIENLFKSSANCCSKLRSLAPLPIANAAAKARLGADSDKPSTAVAMEESRRPAEESMADLPELSESTKRKLAIKWDALVDSHHLTGEYLGWHEKERARLRRIPEACRGLGRDGVWIVKEGLVDREGIAPSVAVAKARFQDLAQEYWCHWSTSAGYEAFASWLEALKAQVLVEIASIWKGSSEAIDRWFEGACRPALETALTALVKQRIAQARAVELQRLERAPANQMFEVPEQGALARPCPVGGSSTQRTSEETLVSDTERAGMEDWCSRLDAKLSPEQRAEIQASLVEIANIMERSEKHQKNLLWRLGVRTNLDNAEEFFLRLWAAGRYVGFSNNEFWSLTPRELCAVLELKVRELELHAGEERAGTTTVDDPGAGSSAPTEARGGDSDAKPRFPNRASWLGDRLRERSWNKHDLFRHGGPDHKTAQKILDGFPVREDVLEKVASGLSRKHGNVGVLNIPQN